MRARRLYAQFNDDSDDSYGSETDTIAVTLPAHGHGKRSVLSSVVAPYSYTYLAVVRSLDELRGHGIIEGEFIKKCVQEITKQIEEGRCKYGKCINNSPINL